MTKTVLKSQVGADGVLSVSVPLGPSEANRQVTVTIEPSAPEGGMTPAEWRSWVESTSGIWEGEFERPPQGEFEDRSAL